MFWNINIGKNVNISFCSVTAIQKKKKNTNAIEIREFDSHRK